MNKLLEQDFPPEELEDFRLVAEEPPIAEVPLPLRRHRLQWWSIAVVSFGTLVALVALVFREPHGARFDQIAECPSIRERQFPAESYSDKETDPNERVESCANQETILSNRGTEKRILGSRSGTPSVAPIAPSTPRSSPRQALSMEYFLKRGISNAKAGMLDDAFADLGEAIKIDPNAARPYHNRGVVWVLKGCFDRAIADFTAAIKIDPQYALAYANRGLAYEKSGRSLKAQSDYAVAERLGMRISSHSAQETYPQNNSCLDENTRLESSLEYYRRRAAKAAKEKQNNAAR